LPIVDESFAMRTTRTGSNTFVNKRVYMSERRKVQKLGNSIRLSTVAGS